MIYFRNVKKEFNIQKSINKIHHINSSGKEKSINTPNAFYKIQHPFLRKTYVELKRYFLNIMKNNYFNSCGKKDFH